MRWFVIAAVLAFPLATTAAAPTKAVTIVAIPAQARVHRGEAFSVELRTVNATDRPQTFRIMSCSWSDEWKTDDAQIDTTGWDCSKNFEITLTLAPGVTDVRTLSLHVGMKATLGVHTFRVGFTAIGSKTSVWSAPAAVRVTAT